MIGPQLTENGVVKVRALYQCPYSDAAVLDRTACSWRRM